MDWRVHRDFRTLSNVPVLDAGLSLFIGRLIIAKMIPLVLPPTYKGENTIWKSTYAKILAPPIWKLKREN
jgi:hypothetical protein